MKLRTVDRNNKVPKRSRRLQNKPPARSNDSVSACERVFATFELLETILLELRPADILICQRISKPFNDLIAHSKQLQRTLCFDPEPPASCSSELRINPFFAPEVPGVDCPLYQSLQTDTLSYPYRSRYRPFQRTFTVEIYVDKDTGERKPGLFLCSNSSVSPQPGFVKEASWLRMYASQPASEIGLYSKLVVEGRFHVYVRLGYGIITHGARFDERLSMVYARFITVFASKFHLDRHGYRTPTGTSLRGPILLASEEAVILAPGWWLHYHRGDWQISG
ncbi:hypothetical protein LTR10_005707 [Elasticomyces elasticus]|nr:hypothetical protein LTR10_005707 [Elasticomyces elasticus]KAK4964915.1 hypothetical protein LTR42_012332 [Elasticomyces elasticus]